MGRAKTSFRRLEGVSAPENLRINLRVEAVTIARGGVTLFAPASFTLAPGAFAALTGPNGAGKTSLLRAIAGLLRPEAGSIAFGEAPETRLHLLGHRDGLKSSLSVRAHALYWAGLLGGTAAAAEAALARVGLARIADLPARALSQGQARRLALTRLLSAPRPLWLLDEPAAALDASGKALVAALIGEHRAGGGMVVAALHEPLAETPSQTIELERAP